MGAVPLLGGLLTAVDRVDVNVIGARSGVLTEIALGQRSFALIEATDLERSLEQMKKEHKELERSLEYLEQQEPSKEISAKISNFRLRYATTGLKLDAMRRRLKLLREERFDPKPVSAMLPSGLSEGENQHWLRYHYRFRPGNTMQCASLKKGIQLR